MFHWFEMCDAVQSESYVIDGKTVINFVLPLYFTASHERGSRNDFLGAVTNGTTLRSFDVDPGGYINFFDPRLGDGGEDTDFSAPDDTVTRKRPDVKNSIGVRRGHRRRLMGGATGV